MIYFSFEDNAFNKDYCNSKIDIIISPKNHYKDQLSFLNAAFEFLGEKVYTDEDIFAEYPGLHLKDGNYGNIVKQWIASMDQSIGIVFDRIIRIQRIKCDTYNPLQDNFLLETDEEYMVFLWSSTA